MAAADQVLVARRSAERQLRAYVGVSSIEMRPAGDHHFACKLGFRNYGQTPAYGCVIHAAAAIEDWPAIDPSESTAELSISTCDLTLQPTAEMSGFAGCDASGRLPNLEEGIAAVYVFGRVKYQDLDGTTRVTAFAYRGTGRVFLRTWEMHPCLGGNAAT